MRDKNIVLSAVILLALSAVLCIASYYASTLATGYDLGQLAYLFFIFFPITAALIGILSNTIMGSWWMAPVMSLLTFAVFMLIKYKTVNITYVLAYMLISIVGYYISHIFRRMMKR